MNRTENDLRDALRELERRADKAGAPPVDTLIAGERLGTRGVTVYRRFPGWLPPLAAAALVAAAAVGVAVVSSGPHRPPTRPTPAAGRPARHHIAVPPSVPPSPAHTAHRKATPDPAAILADAAAKLDSAPWSAPDPQDFYYVRTTDARTWTSVSGTRAGHGRTADGSAISVPGCDHGQIVATGEAGSCTLNDVPHYLADAPTSPSAWGAYLEHLVPGAKAANAQGKFIVEVLHQDLVSPQAAAALLRYTESCAGLHPLDVRPVGGEGLVGVTCTSMTNGSYGLVFDAASHAFVGFVVVTGGGQQDGAAEIVQKTAIVPAIGRTR